MRLPLLQCLPKRVAEEADEDVGADAILALVPDGVESRGPTSGCGRRTRPRSAGCRSATVPLRSSSRRWSEAGSNRRCAPSARRGSSVGVDPLATQWPRQRRVTPFLLRDRRRRANRGVEMQFRRVRVSEGVERSAGSRHAARAAVVPRGARSCPGVTKPIAHWIAHSVSRATETPENRVLSAVPARQEWWAVQDSK